MNIVLFLKKKIIYLSIWLHWVLIVAHRIFVAACGTFSWGMWDLVLWPGIEPRPPALGAQSLSHWTAREVPSLCFRHLMHISFLKINRLFFRPVLGLQRNWNEITEFSYALSPALSFPLLVTSCISVVYFFYNWWTHIDTLLLTKIQGLH